MTDYRYVIVGGGATAASAVDGIRAHDREGRIAILSRENHAPYRRPALSKDLWFGKATLDQISLKEDAFWAANGVDLLLRREAVELEPETRRVWDDRGTAFRYDKLLLATGGKPRLLGAKNEAIEGVHYFRYLEDYLALEPVVRRVGHALVIGGGFLGLELAAAVRHAGPDVTLMHPGPYPLRRVLPRDVASYVAEFYRERGVEMVADESVAAFEEHPSSIVARAHSGNYVDTSLVLIAVGLQPHVELAEAAGLEVSDGIAVDEYARTSDEHIFAAGDVAEYPLLAVGRRTRSEHWDHAEAHGRAAGANMAGANAVYDHVPMFWSDFFDLGWEAVGDLDSGYTIESAWDEPYREGVLFYLEGEIVRGVLLWNRWGLVDWARALVKLGRPTSVEERAVPAKAVGSG